MSLMRCRQALQYGLITELPEQHWLMLYDLMTETFININSPNSPTCVSHEFRDNYT